MDDNYTLFSYSEYGFVITTLSKEQLQSSFSYLHEISDHIDRSALAIEIKNWMDSSPFYGIKGGWGHRIIHGHSISDIFTVYNNHGLSGVLEWSKEMSYDFLSPHGLPFPYANELKTILGLNIHESTEWLCGNFFDYISASITFGVLFSKLEYTLPSSLLVKSLATGIIHLFNGNLVGVIASGAGIMLSFVGIISGEEKIEIRHSYLNFRTFDNYENFCNFQIDSINMFKEKNERVIKMKLPGSNTEVKYTDLDFPLFGFKVGGLGIGGFYVEIHLTSPTTPIIARLEGNEKDCFIKFNHKQLDEILLTNIFHMCRCYREKERTNINREAYINGYKHFREIAVNKYKTLITSNIFKI